MFTDHPKLSLINLPEKEIDRVCLRAFVGSSGLKTLQISGNNIADAESIKRAVRNILNLKILKLDRNMISKQNKASFVDLPALKELYRSIPLNGLLEAGSSGI